jgi:CsoR family transcriptional regulator, copper-sensing transcriptional repressor
LQRIEGQVRGIQKMLESDRECVHIIDQLASVKAAVNVLNASLFETIALHCLRSPDQFETPEEMIDQMTRLLVRAGK